MIHTSRKNKNRTVATTLALAVLATPFMAHAVNIEKGVTHEVSITGISKFENVRPDQVFEIYVDQKDKNFNRIKQQMKNQSFGVLLISDKGDELFLNAKKKEVSYKDGIITVSKHSLFTRYTNYTGTVLIKSDFQQALKGQYPKSASDSISFKTGSDLHEPTTLSFAKENLTPSVLSSHEITLNVTDDYGLPANGAVNITFNENGERLTNSVDIQDINKELVDGYASFKIENHEAEQVAYKLNVESKYGTRSIETNAEYQPGYTEKLEFDIPEKIVVGKETQLSGKALDRYENTVKDGVEIKAISKRGTIQSMQTKNGEFNIKYMPSTKKGNDDLAFATSDSDFKKELEVYNRADHPAKIIPTELPEMTVGEKVNLEFKVLDQYDNLVEDDEDIALSFPSGFMPSLKTKTLNGIASFEWTPQSSGDYYFSIQSESNSFNYVVKTPLKVKEAEPVIPKELDKVTNSGKNVLIVDTNEIKNANGETTKASDVFTKAIEMAEPGDGIYLKAGDYRIESNDVFWVAPHKKYSNMILRKSLTIIGEDASKTTLVIDDSNSVFHSDGRHFAITFASPNITLKNLTIKVKQDKVKSLWAVFNVWGRWDGSTSRGASLENVRVEVDSPIPYLFYMNDYDFTAKNLTVKSNGNIKRWFYWNFGSIHFQDSVFDMSRPSRGTYENVQFNVPSSSL